jgi:death-on-curing protein
VATPPPSEPIWITRELLDGIHGALLAQYGGSFGVKNGPRIAAALAHPRATPTPDLATRAAALGLALVRANGYRDGNKRLAFAALATFLALNGQRLDAPEAEVVPAMVLLAVGTLSEAAFADWLRAHLGASAAA